MKKNKLWIPITACMLALFVIAGAFLLPRLPKKEAAVFPVTMVGYTDFYSGSTESYGMVTTDKVQTLYISSTQTVTEILVYPGQEVKKGDVLFTYDTTLSDLTVERKDLANQQLEVQLKTAQAELAALKKMKPIVYKPGSSSTSTAQTNYSKSPADKGFLNEVYSTKTTGKSSASPLYVWLAINKQVDDVMIDYLFSQATGNPSRIYVVFQTSTNNQTNKEFSSHTGVSFSKVIEMVPTEPTVPSEPVEPTETTPPSESTEPTETTPPSESTEPTTGNDDSSAEPDPAQEPAEEPVGAPTPAQVRTVSYTMSFFTPPSAPKEDSGTVQWNDGYTSAELTAMKKEKEAEIKQLQFDIKMGKAELKIMQKEASDGKVIADFDGVVVHVLEPA